MYDRIEELIPWMVTVIRRQSTIVRLPVSMSAVFFALALAVPSQAAEAAGQERTVSFPISATSQAQLLFD